MQVIRATDTVVSTNGAIFGHPDAEGVARVVHGCLPNSRIWFNYRSPRTAPWGVEEICRQFGYSARYPEDGGLGVLSASFSAAVRVGQVICMPTLRARRAA